MTDLIQLMHSAVIFGTVIMLGAVGEIITEKAGHLNLGVPGIMYIGGISGLVASFFYENSVAEPSGVVSVILSLTATIIGSGLAGLLYGFLTVTLRTNQNVTGLTLTIMGGGIANFFGGMLSKYAGGVGKISTDAASGAYRAYFTPLTGNSTSNPLYAIFGYGWMTYVAIALAVAAHLILKKTRVGLGLRAVGENPATADAAGINVSKYKYVAIIIGSVISGLGGLYYTMDYVYGTWIIDGNIEALGWLAVALVIFTTWKPVGAIWGAYLFGILYWSYLYIPGLTRQSQEIFKMLPYVVTLGVLIVVSLRKKKENLPPEHLGLPYFREER